MRSIEFTIDGEPIPKARPRLSRGHTYTPSRTKKAEQRIAAAFLALREEPFEGAVSIRIDCGFMPPKSWSRKKQAAAVAGEIQKTSKPDTDNLAKTVCDALNGLAWTDDSQIVRLTAAKHYCRESRTVVRIAEETI